jgi:hypothetical protein
LVFLLWAGRNNYSGDDNNGYNYDSGIGSAVSNRVVCGCARIRTKLCQQLGAKLPISLEIVDTNAGGIYGFGPVSKFGTDHTVLVCRSGRARCPAKCG